MMLHPTGAQGYSSYPDGIPLCTACAMFENVAGRDNTLVRDPRMAKLEAVAQWLERQDLLTQAGPSAFPV